MSDEKVEMNIQIGHLLLEGISLASYQKSLLKETMESELQSLLLTKGMPPGIEFSPARINGAAIHLPDRQPAPEQLGKQIAGSIYEGLCGTKPAKE